MIMRKALPIGLALVAVLLLISCGEPKEKATVWKPNELVKIDSVVVGTEEAAVYGIQVKKEFERIGGEDIWEFESFSGDKSAYEVAKTKVLENLIRVKILAAKAKERKMVLTAEEEAQVKEGAKLFYEDEEVKKSDEPIDLATVENVITEFELGRKLKRDMLISFEPPEDMIDKKLMEDESYQEILKDDPHRHYEEFVVEVAEVTKPEQIQRLEQALNEGVALSQDMIQELVFQEKKYFIRELEENYGFAVADELRAKEMLAIPWQENSGFYILKIKEIHLHHPNKLHQELKEREEQIEKIKAQAEEEIKDESFDVIYKEWKKDTNIQVNQELWQDYQVFSLHE